VVKPEKEESRPGSFLDDGSATTSHIIRGPREMKYLPTFLFENEILRRWQTDEKVL